MSDEKARPRQLGRGLEALFGEDRTNIAAAEAAVDAGARPAPAADAEAPATETPARSCALSPRKTMSGVVRAAVSPAPR